MINHSAYNPIKLGLRLDFQFLLIIKYYETEHPQQYNI